MSSKEDLELIKKALNEIQGGLYPKEKEALTRIEKKLEVLDILKNHIQKKDPMFEDIGIKVYEEDNDFEIIKEWKDEK